MPSPELTSNPPIIVAKVITFETKSSVIITEDAQFGINPIAQIIAEPITGLDIIRLFK